MFLSHLVAFAFAVEPTTATVTLGKDLLLTQVLAEIKRQTGIAIENQLGDAAVKVGVSGKDIPFWKALDQVAERTSARVVIAPHGGRISLVKRTADERKPIVSYSGPFRFCVKRVTAVRDFDTGAHAYHATVEVAWEPGLKPLFLETIPQGVLVRDDVGRRYPVLDGGKSKAPVDGRTSLLIDVPLTAVPRTVTHLAQVEGQLEAVVPSRMLRFEFPPPLTAPAQLTQSGVTCKVARLALGKERWTVQLAIENPPGGTILESYQPWDSNNQLTLVRNDGKTRIPANSYVRESESSRRAFLSYHFTEAARLAKMNPADWHLEYETPALVVTVPLSFSFRDVPLP